MSVNRSVQAAQRRRAGPTGGPEPPRGPSTSINSAQMVANQARPGAGPNIPAGRLAAQQMNQTQSRMQQQQQPQQVKSQDGFSKMTLAQAITLITLRLGKVEQSIMDIEQRGFDSVISSSDSSGLDKSALDSIVSRLESLERRPTNSPDVSLLKQQIDTIKPVVAQSKTASLNLAKENSDLKNEVATLKGETSQLKEMIDALRMDFETLGMSMMGIEHAPDIDTELVEQDDCDEIIDEDVDGENGDADENDEFNNDMDINQFENQIDSEIVMDDEHIEITSTEIVGTDLKQMIEQELNSSVASARENVVKLDADNFSSTRKGKNRRR